MLQSTKEDIIVIKRNTPHLALDILELEIKIGFRLQERGWDPNPYIQRIRKTPQGLIEAYFSTTHCVVLPGLNVDLVLDKRSEKLDNFLRHQGYFSWVLITAENPYSVQLSIEENNERTKVLGNFLLLEGFKPYRAAGLSVNRKPIERCYLVPELDLEQAECLGHLFHQYAIIHGDVGRPAEILFC